MSCSSSTRQRSHSVAAARLARTMLKWMGCTSSGSCSIAHHSVSHAACQSRLPFFRSSIARSLCESTCSSGVCLFEAPSPPDSCVRSTRRPGGAIAPSIATQRIMLLESSLRPSRSACSRRMSREGGGKPRTKVAKKEKTLWAFYLLTLLTPRRATDSLRDRCRLRARVSCDYRSERRCYRISRRLPRPLSRPTSNYS